MKKSKIIVPALGIIAFATAASITGTVAWFTANSRVEIKGMQFKTRVSDNLFVSRDNSEANFKESLTQDVKGILLPASTVDGISYFYTTDAKADGSITDSGTYTAYTGHDAAGASGYGNKFSEDYNLTTSEAGGLVTDVTKAQAYLDYSFYLKANFVSANATYLYMSKCDLVSSNETQAEKAWRVAVFFKDTAATSTGCTAVADNDLFTTANSNATLSTIIAPTGAENQTVVSTKNQAVNGTAKSALADVVKDSEKALIYTHTAGSDAETLYFRVVVRIWLEGEDKTCTVDTFKTLTDKYELNLEFEASTTNSGVQAVTVKAAA